MFKCFFLRFHVDPVLVGIRKATASTSGLVGMLTFASSGKPGNLCCEHLFKGTIFPMTTKVSLGGSSGHLVCGILCDMDISQQTLDRHSIRRQGWLSHRCLTHRRLYQSINPCILVTSGHQFVECAALLCIVVCIYYTIYTQIHR